jgi:hypothetical protein
MQATQLQITHQVPEFAFQLLTSLCLAGPKKKRKLNNGQFKDPTKQPIPVRPGASAEEVCPSDCHDMGCQHFS